MNKRFGWTVALVAVLVAAPLTAAADWSRWLGPQQNGTSSDRGVVGEEPSLSLAWEKPLGTGYSAIALAGGKAVTMYGDGEKDWLIALDQKSGGEMWRYEIGKQFPKVGGADGGPLSMPVVEGGTVYALGAEGDLFAVKLADGKPLWRIDVEEDHGAKRPYFGFTTTPLVVGELLFVETGGEGGNSLAAFDRKTGKRRWATGDETVAYQSPVWLKLGGEEQIVAVTNLTVKGLDPADGSVLWSHEHGVSPRDGASTAIALGDDSFLLTGRSESAAFRLADGKVTELWKNSNLKGSFVMPVVHDGHIYGVNARFLTCVDAATGEQRWKARESAAGLILVDSNLVLFGGEGEVVVGPADPAGFTARARLKVAETGGYTFPSYADGGVFVRNLEKIARVDVKAGG